MCIRKKRGKKKTCWYNVSSKIGKNFILPTFFFLFVCTVIFIFLELFCLLVFFFFFSSFLSYTHANKPQVCPCTKNLMLFFFLFFFLIVLPFLFFFFCPFLVFRCFFFPLSFASPFSFSPSLYLKGSVLLLIICFLNQKKTLKKKKKKNRGLTCEHTKIYNLTS